MENTAILICLFILLMGTEAQAAQPKKDLSYQERRARAKKIQPELQALVDQFEARTFDDGKGETIANKSPEAVYTDPVSGHCQKTRAVSPVSFWHLNF
jgi:hypothetical protein